jgi:hypothetical protein
LADESRSRFFGEHLAECYVDRNTNVLIDRIIAVKTNPGILPARISTKHKREMNDSSVGLEKKRS